MIKKLAIFLFSMVAGIFLLRASEAFWRHDWWVVVWDLALTTGWSLGAWGYLKELKAP